ncbi:MULTISPECIES: hypothetical protein [Paenibacillus]|uniref:hypothetical protein n=1 Tax=Paenibacillus TaxID=44249 RepID=UPI000F51EA59|nr:MULTISPECIES: hypothetical protein [Paenibacillus]KAA8748145.1 hypothetical protein FE296_18770 [Paenibacillus sp. UASWS1643]MDR6718388.1 hypothetical protein [Paenibacillus sp. 2003]RPK27890.1 hypothetical protein EDO6_03413 [Paenibacillus xylanexedens]
MVKRRSYVLACAALAMMVALSACSSAAEEPTGETEKVDTEVSSGTGEQATNEGASEATTSAVTETEGTTAPAGSDSDSGEEATAGTNELPENLPSDFPLPEDATIRLANSGENEGKQSAMVIFTTEQDMQTVSELYKDYFDAKKLTNAGQTIDDKNIIIQGTDPETQDVWSLIGGALASQEGVIELTLSWTES